VCLDRLDTLNAEFSRVVKEIEELNARVSVAQAENTALLSENNSLKTQLSEVAQEKEMLQARLSSIAELKKAIREVKKQMRQARRDITAAVRPQEARIIEGNRGFIIKNGLPTYPTRVKIEVRPLPDQQQ